jgi:dipeptidyl aminopeptidase/acylaminoacyl peptidase
MEFYVKLTPNPAIRQAPLKQSGGITLKKTKSDYISITDLLSLPTLSDVTISECGQRSAFVKRTADWERDTYTTHIEVYQKGEKVADVHQGFRPLWSPCSEQLAFMRTQPNGNQLFLQSLKEGKRVQLTDTESGIASYKWDPTGKCLFCTVPDHSKHHRLQYLDLEERGSLLPLLEEGVHVLDFDPSFAGGKIIFLASPGPGADDAHKAELYLLNRFTGAVRKIEESRRLGGQVCMSPQGTHICYTVSREEKDFYQNHIPDSTLEIQDLTTGERMQPLPEADSTWMPIRWTEQGILVKWQDRTNGRIGLLQPDGNLELYSDEDGYTLGASISANGHHVACLKAHPNETLELYMDGEKVTDENDLLSHKRISRKKVITWSNHDGETIEGVLSIPDDMDRDRAHPLLVLIHGGPNWASFPFLSTSFNDKYPVESFTEKGFIVLEPNYRGSTGYGDTFMKANERNLGIGDYEDVISGVDALAEQGIADRDAVGIMGWSQGGFITAFSSIYSNRFKAASVGGGISNWVTNYTNTDLPSNVLSYLGDTPWNEPDIYAKCSPLWYVQSACTPTLIQHGEADARVPVENAHELYKGLKDQGVEVELNLFKGMGYSSDHPEVHKLIMEQNLEWFTRHILDGGARSD